MSNKTSKSKTKSNPEAISELTSRNIQSIVQSEASEQQKRKVTDIIAERITRFCGTAAFLWFHVLWFGGWISCNLALPEHSRWDPSPFPFLTLVVSLEAIFLSTFILIAENRQSFLAERRSHLDLQINLLAEQENTKILELLEQIAARLGVKIAHDHERKAMQENTEPEKVLRQIDESIKSKI